VHPSEVGADGATSQVEVDGNLTWNLDKDEAYAKARKQGKPVFIDFFGAWCTNCKAFQALTKRRSGTQCVAQKAVLLKVEDTTSLFRTHQSMLAFRN
jgi:thiol:disulfide interchange protein DsbD